MKIYSLLVCFFVVLNTTSLNLSFESKISNIEQKIERVNESQAIQLSKQCQELNVIIQKSCSRLDSKRIYLKKICHKKEKHYLNKKRKMDMTLLKEVSSIKTLQESNDYVLIYQLTHKFERIQKELNDANIHFKKSKKEYQNILDLYNRHKDWCDRLNTCQKRLFVRFKNLRGITDDYSSFTEDKKIYGNDKLPSYGAIENIDEGGMSCLNGHYEIDSISDFWIFPIENGTISAYTWYYPSGGLHLGLDVASAMFSNVYACGNGLILYADACVDSNNGYLGNWCGWPNGGGNTICMIVAMGDGLYGISYNHLSDQIFVSSGQQVKQSDRIALSGNSGNSSGPHTHIEVFRLKKDLQTIVDYFKEGADFSFGCGWKEPATCSQYACRIEPSEVLEGV